MKKLFLIALLLSGCSTLDTANLEEPFCTANDCYKELDQHSAASANDRKAKIGFVEFNDHGFQKDSGAVKQILANISDLNTHPDAPPLLLVVFIHGWHHNASQDDSNVKSFEAFLTNIQHEENSLSYDRPRQVVGVYIGWRGESNESLLNPLTYRSRKLAGLRVGQYGLQEILAELNLIRRSDKYNRLVSVGHSFGGGVLYSSVMQKLVDDVVSAKPDPQSGTLPVVDKAYGDLVILMNPALEAARVEVLTRRLSEVERFNSCQPLVLASFTSEYDSALSDFFPKGQTIFFQDDKKVARADGYDHLVTNSYGNEISFRTHELACEECTYDQPQTSLTALEYVLAHRLWKDFRSRQDKDFVVDRMTLSHYENSPIKPGSPIINVYVKGDNLIKDHNAIWGTEFSKFARALIGMEFSRQNNCPDL